MKWFFNWLRTNIEKTNVNLQEYCEPIVSHTGRVRDSSELSSRSTTFNLYQANGGYVIELRNYDRIRDEWHNSLHVVHHNEDLGKSLEHIITLEALKK